MAPRCSTPPPLRPLLYRVVVAVVVALTAFAGAPLAIAQDDARPIWGLPVSGDLFSAFDRTEYNEQDGTPRQVDNPDEAGRRSLEFSLDGGAQRSELQPRTAFLKEGDVRYYGYQGRLAADFPTDVSTWQLILQWHQIADSGSPPIAVEVRDGRLQLSLEGADYQDLGPIAGGQAIDLVIKIVFSEDRSKGTVDVWNAGRHVLTSFRPPNSTLIDEGAYMKVGLYRDRAIDEPATLYLDDLRVGPSMQTVRDADSPLPVEESDPSGTASGSGSGGGSDSSVAPWLAGVLVLAVTAATALRLRGSRAR